MLVHAREGSRERLQRKANGPCAELRLGTNGWNDFGNGIIFSMENKWTTFAVWNAGMPSAYWR